MASIRRSVYTDRLPEYLITLSSPSSSHLGQSVRVSRDTSGLPRYLVTRSASCSSLSGQSIRISGYTGGLPENSVLALLCLERFLYCIFTAQRPSTFEFLSCSSCLHLLQSLLDLFLEALCAFPRCTDDLHRAICDTSLEALLILVPVK